ncbi:AraC family transcriptional regulator [Planomonospora sp. ID67723]|uniref:helix-turn-helix domain-containing protein n=1 Tax=Planomonospora sp. ID67723 TaxID=2738134 RepID=UPI0018C4195E|nr:helix-turn-helix domain-containing protein [Planomonospora sp. ID67723]MBG0832785.1 AraC family transcriptional regulator [Planomonospora sp. ID67723]
MDDTAATGGLTSVEGRPGAFLRPYVTELTAYTERYEEPLTRRQPPFAGVVVIFGFGEPLGLSGPGTRGRLASFAGGLHTTYVDTTTAGVAEGVQVNLTPLGARRLFGLPMSELANRVLSLDDVLGPWAGTAVERLAATPGRHDRLALLDALLTRRIHAAPDPDPRVRWAWQRLRAARGALPIAELTGELGWSHRHLVSRFHDQIGMSPKAVARVMRFEHAAARLRAGLPAADTAAACGYYDQAHMSRDFRAMAGTTPRQLAGLWPERPIAVSG